MRQVKDLAQRDKFWFGLFYIRPDPGLSKSTVSSTSQKMWRSTEITKETMVLFQYRGQRKKVLTFFNKHIFKKKNDTI